MIDPAIRGVPRPIRRFGRDPVGVPAAVVVALIGSLLAVLVAPSVRAAGPDPLAGPFVDVAFVPFAGPAVAGTRPGDAAAGAGPAGAPRLLAVRPPDPHEPGTVHVALLARGPADWTVVATRDIRTDLGRAGPAWLISLDDRTFAVLSVAADLGRTSLTVLVPEAGAIRQVASATISAVATGAGGADVDGDGRPELVIAAAPPPEGCPGTDLLVVDPTTAVIRDRRLLTGVRLEGAAVGRLGDGGDGLVAYSSPACAADPTRSHGPATASIVAVNLGSGRSATVGHLGDDALAVGAVGPRIPLLVDLDGDGIDEAIVRDGQATIVLDPARGWRREVIVEDAIPLGVVGGPGRPRLLAVYEPDRSVGRGPRIGLFAVGRPTSGAAAVRRALAAIPLGVADPLTGRLAGIEAASDPAAPPPDWYGDPGGTGCPALLLPRATFLRCADGDPGRWVARAGPTWAGTTPLGAYGQRGGRRLLVAAGLSWSAAGAGLVNPAPAAARSDDRGGWRSGPSGTFALEELDGDDIGYFTAFPTPNVDIDPTAGGVGSPEVIFGGTAGDRVFVRISPLRPQQAGSSPAGAGSPAAPAATPRAGPPRPGSSFLEDPPPDGSGIVALIPVRGRSTAGANLGFVRVPLPLAGDATSAPPTAWAVQAVGVNAYGEISVVADARVAIDTVGPNVIVDPPIVSAPWPFSAPIRGVTESGARLRLGSGGPTVEAARNGTFELRAQLAPWPQILEIHALDARGNETIREVSVIGGVDYRRLPWQAILIAAVLLGAAATTWRGPASWSRRRDPGRDSGRGPGAAVPLAPHAVGSNRTIAGLPIRSLGWRRPTTPGDETAEIEDLPPEPRPRPR